jgi:hypothetical protein
MISSKLNSIVSCDFLSPVPSGMTLSQLSQPQVDTIIGYLSNNQALSIEALSATAFSVDKEDILASFTLNMVLTFPSLNS